MEGKLPDGVIIENMLIPGNIRFDREGTGFMPYF